MNQEKSIFEVLSPKQTFLFGIVGGFLVFCTIGFFILLNMYLGGDFAAKKADAGSNNRIAVADQGAQPSQPTQPTQPLNGSVREVDESVDHIRGNVDASITIVEYSDLECPFCSRFHDTMKQVIDQYGDDVRWVYRHFPLTSIHPNAVPAALASECAGAQGKFWEFTDLVFESQAAGVNTTALQGIAQRVGLNMNQYNDCVESREFQSKVTQDTQDAAAVGGRGTPHSILIGPNGETQVISGAQPFTVVEQAIQQYL